MNLLHDDHATFLTHPLYFTVATIGSHEIGNICTTLAKGRTYGSYSLRTIESWGDKGSAE